MAGLFARRLGYAVGVGVGGSVAMAGAAVGAYAAVEPGFRRECAFWSTVSTGSLSTWQKVSRDRLDCTMVCLQACIPPALGGVTHLCNAVRALIHAGVMVSVLIPMQCTRTHLAYSPISYFHVQDFPNCRVVCVEH